MTLYPSVHDLTRGYSNPNYNHATRVQNTGCSTNYSGYPVHSYTEPKTVSFPSNHVTTIYSGPPVGQVPITVSGNLEPAPSQVQQTFLETNIHRTVLPSITWEHTMPPQPAPVQRIEPLDTSRYVTSAAPVEPWSYINKPRTLEPSTACLPPAQRVIQPSVSVALPRASTAVQPYRPWEEVPSYSNDQNQYVSRQAQKTGRWRDLNCLSKRPLTKSTAVFSRRPVVYEEKLHKGQITTHCSNSCCCVIAILLLILLASITLALYIAVTIFGNDNEGASNVQNIRVTYDVRFTMPDELYASHLKNPSSLYYQTLSNKACILMKRSFSSNTLLKLDSCHVLQFSSGSVVATVRIGFKLEYILTDASKLHEDEVVTYIENYMYKVISPSVQETVMDEDASNPNLNDAHLYQESMHFIIGSGDMCKNNHLCMNRASCVAESDTQFNCNCKNGFSGRLCAVWKRTTDAP